MINSVDFTKLKVGNYNRKSSEAEDKQMLSIDSQTDEAKKIADFYRLPKFIDVFKESKSAKKEYERAEFTRMMKKIYTGEIDSIVCWKLDRLARNMTEGGQIIDLLSSGVIKAIITHDKVFYPWDNVIVMSVEFSQGKQFVKDLSVNVKRGQEKKARMGVPHGVASLGFINDKTEEKGNRAWLVDEPRLRIIKALLEMFLSDSISAGKLYQYAVNELGLTTVKRKRIGGNLIVLSRIYEILRDPIYAGFFFYGGERYELASQLPRLITEDQHIKIKNKIARKSIPKIQHHETTYSGFLLSEKGDFMGQDLKFQLICDCKYKFAYRDKDSCPKCNKKIENLESPKYLDYTFYYNVKKKKAGKDYKALSENKIQEKMVQYALEHLTFSDELIAWSKKYIVELKDKEINESIFREEKGKTDKSEYEAKKTRLREMLRDSQITDEEYKMDLNTLNEKYTGLLHKKNESLDWYAKMNEIADLTFSVASVLEKGTIKAKRDILSRLGSNLTWNDEILIISNSFPINKLVEGVKRAKLILPEFEPKNCLAISGLNEKTDRFQPVFSTMLRG